MSVVLGSYGGEVSRDYADPMALTRIGTREARLERAIEMFLMRRAGVPARVIARKFRICPDYVRQEIKAVPEWEKERVLEFGLRVG